MAPSLTFKHAGSEFRANAGSVGQSGKDTQGQKMSFSYVETPVTMSNLGDSVEWQIDSPRGAKAVRDYYVGNVTLSATLQWSWQVAGSATAIPAKLKSSRILIAFDPSLRKRD